jgi:glycosyltransferase involved in cell wall biosynthesis
MRILHVSNEIRHELGCAASLQMLGYDVTYLHIDNKHEPLHRKVVCTDQGSVEVNSFQINSPTLLQSIIHPQNFIPSENVDENFDLIIATTHVPFHIARYVAKKQGIPIVLRVPHVRANKLIDHIIYGKNYQEMLKYYPSTLHNLTQIWNSQALVVMDDATRDFLRKLPLFKKLNMIYPTYAALYGENSRDLFRIEELTGGRNYIFNILNLIRLEQYLIKVLYCIARKSPEIDVIIAGATIEEAKKKFLLPLVPKNLKFVGKVTSDNALKVLYENATLVVIPIFSRALSNRLLEALYYGRPILTNIYAKLIFKKLEHLHHIFISDNYAEYPSIIRKLFKNEALLEELALGAKKAYNSFFSARKCGFAMKRVIERIVSDRS